MEWVNFYGTASHHSNGGLVRSKKVMVVVDETSCSKDAMMWALSHVAGKGDSLHLLFIIPPSGSIASPTPVLHSLGSYCKSCKPELEIEALVIKGHKLGTIVKQVKKRGIAVVVLGQKKPSSFSCCSWLSGNRSREEFVEECINTLDCMTIGVRKQKKGVNGYIINTKFHRNFWLLA